MEFPDLSEDCVAVILSHTTPLDVCRLSLVSKLFHSAADSDTVWERFLTPDHLSIISECSLSNYPSKKTLYLALADHPVIFEGKKVRNPHPYHSVSSSMLQSLHLEKKSGKKCFMFAASALSIIWGKIATCWKWTTDPSSRFPEVAEVINVWWFEVEGVFDTRTLSPATQYAAYFVFKMIDPNGFKDLIVEVSIDFYKNGREIRSPKNVCLNGSSAGRKVAGLQRPSFRSDGWLEIEIGEFFTVGLENEVFISVKEGTYEIPKFGLLVEGIEIRPK